VTAVVQPAAVPSSPNGIRTRAATLRGRTAGSYASRVLT
jgi:hypothetical protein